MALADRSDLEQAALRYCGPAGVPLSVFLGRVILPGQPTWTDDDRRAALEWRYEEDLKCPGCGQRRTESMAHEDEAPKYEAEVLQCHACGVADIERRALTKDGGSAAALYSFVKKVG